MLDLIGYWTSVTLITFTLLMPLLALSAIVAYKLTFNITKSEDLAERARDSIFDTWYVNNKGRVLSCIQMPDELMVFVSIIGVLGLLILSIPLVYDSVTYVESVHTASTYLASYAAWISIGLGLYYGVSFVGRKLYVLGQKVNKLCKKVEDCEED
jgi:hypothetical protein